MDQMEGIEGNPSHHAINGTTTTTAANVNTNQLKMSINNSVNNPNPNTSTTATTNSTAATSTPTTATTTTTTSSSSSTATSTSSTGTNANVNTSANSNPNVLNPSEIEVTRVVTSFLQRHGQKEAEAAVESIGPPEVIKAVVESRNESGVVGPPVTVLPTGKNTNSLGMMLMSSHSQPLPQDMWSTSVEAMPKMYDRAFTTLRQWIHQSLDNYKVLFFGNCATFKFIIISIFTCNIYRYLKFNRITSSKDEIVSFSELVIQ